MSVQKIAVELLIPTPDNPRHVDPKDPAIIELAQSIAQTGQLQNGVARPHPTKPGHFDLRAGACRLAAIKLAGLPTMDVAVLDLDDRQAMKITVIENMQRQNLTPMQDARGVAKLLEVGYDVDAIAAETGKTPTWIKRRAQLTKLTAAWQQSAEEFQIRPSILELVARYDKSIQNALWEDKMRQSWERNQLIGRQGEAYVRDALAAYTHELRLAPWPLNDSFLVPKAGPCDLCPKRSACNPDLFEEFTPKRGKQASDRCLDGACWDNKAKVFTAAQLKVVMEKHKTVLKVSTGLTWPDRGVLGKEDFRLAKEGDKGAVPAVDESAGSSLVWVVPKKTKSGQKAGAKASGKPALTMKEKREGLQRRRIAHVLTGLQKALRATKELPAIAHYATPQGLVELVCIFDTGRKLYDPDRKEPFPGVSEWAALAKAKKDPAKALQAVWKMLCDSLVEQVSFYSTGGISDDHEESARQVAGLLGLKYQDLLDEAEREIPEPKAWAKQK